VRHKPGVELVAEANTAYWRKVPSVKRIVLRSIPDDTTRLAVLKRGEADVAFALQGPVAEEVRQRPALKLLPVMLGAIASLDFPEQWDAKSPWHDVRVRQAASLAVDRHLLNDTELLGHGRVGGALVPPEYEFSLDLPAAAYDPERAKTLLAEAGYPRGFEAGDLTPIAPYFSVGEAVGNYLRAIGIKTRLRMMERATFFSMRREHALKGVILGSPGMSGNAATWLDGYAMSWETRQWGGDADLDDLFRRQGGERDRAEREAVLHEIQRRIYNRVMLAPLLQFAWLVGVARRVDEPALGLIQTFPYSAPYEDIRLSTR